MVCAKRGARVLTLYCADAPRCAKMRVAKPEHLQRTSCVGSCFELGGLRRYLQVAPGASSRSGRTACAGPALYIKFHACQPQLLNWQNFSASTVILYDLFMSRKYQGR